MKRKLLTTFLVLFSLNGLGSSGASNGPDQNGVAIPIIQDRDIEVGVLQNAVRVCLQSKLQLVAETALNSKVSTNCQVSIATSERHRGQQTYYDCSSVKLEHQSITFFGEEDSSGKEITNLVELRLISEDSRSGDDYATPLTSIDFGYLNHYEQRIYRNRRSLSRFAIPYFTFKETFPEGSTDFLGMHRTGKSIASEIELHTPETQGYFWNQKTNFKAFKFDNQSLLSCYEREIENALQ